MQALTGWPLAATIVGVGFAVTAFFWVITR